MQTPWQDLRYGARMLLKKPGFTLIAVITLALGIGANTAIFSVVNALLLRPLPYHEPERLVMLAEKSRDGGRLTVPYPNFEDWRTRAQSFEAMAAVRTWAWNLTGVDKPVQLRGRTVNWNFFQVLGVAPQLGRSFVAEDDRYGAARTALLSNGLWKERFGGDVNVIGKKLLLSGEPYEVIGVAPPGFEYFRADDVYVPIGLFLQPNSALMDRGSSAAPYAVARLKPGVTPEQANSEMDALGKQLAQEYPAVNSGKSAMALRLQDVMSENVRQSLWILLGAVGFILLIACVNVANLLLVRAADRQKEIAVRLALGAGRARLIRQLLSESLLIAALGGAVGLLAGSWMLDGLLALAPENTPNLSRVGLDQTVLLFTMGIAVLTSLLSGLLPAWQASRVELQTALKEGGRSAAGSSRERVRKTLLVVEVSLALVLLAGAGLLVRSMYNLLRVDPGFNPDNLLTMRLAPTGEAYTAPRLRAFYDECLARVSALPGVRAAALTLSLPIDGSNWNSIFIAADKPVPPRPDLPNSAFAPVSANYFEAMGIRLLKGRGFTSADREDSVKVVVINETLARRIWPGEEYIGKRLKQGWPESQSPWLEVVGVVADVKLNGVERNTPMQAYLPLTQLQSSSVGLVVRTVGNPSAMAAAVERAIHEVDKDLPVSRVRTMDQMLGNALAQRRLTLTLLASFAVLALLLAALGIYGVIAYSVRQRTHEIGVRMALGAQARDVLRLVIGQGLRLALIGIAVGLAGTFALTRWMETLLFGVPPTDAATFGVVAVLLAIVAVVACWIPARRATKVDPMVALRCE
ncbi:MAG: ABC transporter permease [Blastocatellia bacterium]